MAEAVCGLAVPESEIDTSPTVSPPRKNPSTLQKRFRNLVTFILMSLPTTNAQTGEPINTSGVSEPIPLTSSDTGVVVPDEECGKVFMVGGGTIPESIYEEFLKEAGENTKLIIISTPSGDALTDKNPWNYWKGKKRPKEAVMLHAETKEQAMDPEFSKVMEEENAALWVSGGDQGEMEIYHGTPVAERTVKLNRRGRPVGGTSAGAAVWGKRVIKRGLKKAELGPGLNVLHERIVPEQHYGAREGREERLAGVIDLFPEEELLGLGVPEETSAIVQGTRLQIVGKAGVTLVLQGYTEHLKPGMETDLNTILDRLKASKMR